jgi:hypothetical protein
MHVFLSILYQYFVQMKSSRKDLDQIEPIASMGLYPGRGDSMALLLMLFGA